MLIYVDDIVLTENDIAHIQQLIHKLSCEFALKDLGALHCFFLELKLSRPQTKESCCAMENMFVTASSTSPRCLVPPL